MNRAISYKPEIVMAWFKEHGLFPTPEFKFDSIRKWRFDFAFEKEKVALEVEGGVWTNGRHTRPTGYLKDMQKYNAAAVQGWRILRTTPYELCMQETLDLVLAALGGVTNKAEG